MSNHPFFSGELRELPPSSHRSPNSAGPSDNVDPYVNPAQQRPYYNNEEYHGFSQPEELQGMKLDINRPKLRPVFNCESDPHTPTEQIPPQLGSGLEDIRAKHRFGSVSSIATTDDDDMGGNEIHFPWNEQQEQLVKEIYEELTSKPNITPFSGSVPPSGILHRVAKDSLRMAKHKGVYFPHSMDSVRQRVIYLCQGEPEPLDGLEKYNIPQDYFTMAASTSNSNRPTYENDEEFDFLDAYTSSSRQSVEEKYGLRSQGQNTLAAPFREPPPAIPYNHSMTDEEIVNIVAKRKRDSLRMKRGPH